MSSDFQTSILQYRLHKVLPGGPNRPALPAGPEGPADPGIPGGPIGPGGPLSPDIEKQNKNKAFYANIIIKPYRIDIS